MPRSQTPGAHRLFAAALTAVALTLSLSACVEDDYRYRGDYYGNDYRNDRYSDRYRRDGRQPTRNAPDGFYIDRGTPYEKRYHSYEHYADEMRNQRHRQQQQQYIDTH